ncbi:hypothetical protein Tco_0344478 [Tanacetum coccineum]
MSDMTALLNDLSYIPPNNEHNEPTQGDIGETSNEPTQAIRNKFEELYASANEELYPDCDYVTRLDFMAKFTYFKGDDNKDLDFCPVYNTSRWKDNNTPGKKVPKKHTTGKCTEAGKMQHPVDGRAWKNFDTKYPDFAKEPRNVRLGLAADGFNPFDNLSQAYSMWPVILTTYNLPPWLCMKESSFMLTLLIHGPKSSGKDIDVYLRPLIEDLKVLWDRKGVKTIDIASGQKFYMRAMVLWTINDFPARSSLSGRFLKKPHKWRSSREFNGQTDNRDPPKEFGRDEILAQLDRLPTSLTGKHLSFGGVKIKRNVLVELNWTKWSIFYELEYWSFITLRHNLDIMHIKKNVLEAILNTLLMNDKSKDTAKARQDLQMLGIRSGLWLGQTKNGKCLKPQAAYSFTPENRKKFCQYIKGVKLPDGFGSCFKHKVTDNDTNITGLKSHDCHIMMQRLLPYGLQNYLPDKIAKPIIDLCSLFKQICSATLMEDDMLKAQIKVVDILCELELIYPPAFFDIMVHLVIHLPIEALEGGPIRPRWMYPFERYMKKLKGYVRNKAKPEGSIAEGYVAEEALTFSSHYFRDVTTKFNRPDRNVDPPPSTCRFQVFRSVCKPIGLRSFIRFDAQELKKVKWYVLHNSPEIDTYRSQFKSLFPNKDMQEEFPDWFGSQIRQRHVDNDQDPEVSTTSELFALANGPSWTPISINSCVVDGVRYVVHSRDERRTTQNSGICSPGPDGEMYYGQLQEIIEFKYLLFKVALFRVKWFDTSNKGRKVNKLVLRNNMTQIDCSREAFKDDQYILVTQVKQVFYLEDKTKPHWKVVEHVNHKKFSDGGVIVVEDDPDIIHFDNSPSNRDRTALTAENEGENERRVNIRGWNSPSCQRRKTILRNVRLGLVLIGFNPLGTLVGLQTFGGDIETYNCLVAFDEDLKVFMTGKLSRIIDVASGQKFNMRAMVLWTINDFTARSSLSGWSGQGLKSHDCHIIMQCLLPYGLQNYFPDKIAKPIIKLCSLFKQICSTTLMEDDMLKAQIKVVDILCDLELIYPPALFDIMIHLVIHLPLEALEGGPIRPRWMFPFERYMKKLKGYVRNKAKPEGSIAEGYVAEEALTFSSHYFRDVTTKFNRPDRNVDPPPPTCQFQVFRSLCKSIGLRSVIRFDAQELKKVIWYVLHNSPEIDTYRSQFKSLFPNKDMQEEFPDWFGSQIRQRHVDNDPGVSATSELFALACGPTPTPISVNSYVVNGVRFVVHSRDERRTTQNSGICSPGPDGEMYYGQLQEILEFKYLLFKVALFRVKWFDTSNKGRKVKKLILRNNMTQIDCSREAFKDDQYILVTQVKQVFYLEDKTKPHWKVVEHVNHKKFSDGGVIVVEDDPDIIHFDNSSDLPLSTSLNDLDNATLHIDGQSTEVDAPPDIIDVVDQDDDITDDEDALPHDLADSDDEDLINVDDDGVDKMSADVARSHGDDGGGEKGPVPIRFELRDKQTLMPLDDHAAHWSSYIGEVIRGVPLYYPSWLKVLKERKAALITSIGTQFDPRPHMESPDWTEINADIQQHLQKAYNTNKAAFKAQHWVIDPTTRTYNVEKIRRARPEDITAEEWEKYIKFWNDPRNIARAAQNRQNRAKSTVISRQGSRSLARLRDKMRQSSGTQEYPSLIDTFFVAHTVNGEFLQDEDRRGDGEAAGSRLQHRVGCALSLMKRITAMARKGSSRGNPFPGVGEGVLPGRARDVLIPPPPPPPQCTHNSSDVEKLKKKNKYLTKQVNLMMKLFRSDDKFSQMLRQYESTPEFGSGSGGCGDDEIAETMRTAARNEEYEEDGDKFRDVNFG